MRGLGDGVDTLRNGPHLGGSRLQDIRCEGNCHLGPEQDDQSQQTHAGERRTHLGGDGRLGGGRRLEHVAGDDMAVIC
jgi:hypothetical protein